MQKEIAFIVGIIAVAFYLLGYAMKRRKMIITFNVTSRLLYIVQYLLLGAISGAALDIVGAASSLLAAKKESRIFKKFKVAIFIIVNCLIVMAGILVWDNIYSVLPILGVLFHTSAFWIDDEKIIRRVSLLGCPFWLAYNFIYSAYGSCIGDVLSIATLVWAMIKYDFKKGEKKMIKLGNVMILGDSYSTFKGYIPEGYEAHYYPERPDCDVLEVEKTWWMQLINETDSELILNTSFSGTTFGYTGYNGEDYSYKAFPTRFDNLKKEGFFEKNKIDTLFIFGGTNDSWANAPIGEDKYSDWEREDMYKVLPALCYLLKTVTETLPKAKIYCLINDCLKEEITEGIKRISTKYGVEYIMHENIDKFDGHPDFKGMTTIKNQILEHIKK